MTYSLIYTQNAFLQIQKFDSVVKRKIKQKIELYAANPLAYAKRLTNPAIGTYRWRIGQYRVIFDLDHSRLVVLRVAHRKEIYRQ